MSSATVDSSATTAAAAAASHHHKPSFSRFTTAPAVCSNKDCSSSRAQSPQDSNCSSPDGSRSSSRRRPSFGSIKEDVDGKSSEIASGLFICLLFIIWMLIDKMHRRCSIFRGHPYRPISERNRGETRVSRYAASPRLLLPLRWISGLETNPLGRKEPEQELQRPAYSWNFAHSRLGMGHPPAAANHQRDQRGEATARHLDPGEIATRGSWYVSLLFSYLF